MEDQDIVLVPQHEEQIALGAEENEDIRLMADESQSENFALDFGEVTDVATQDFNRLYNRPSYNNEIMTNETNIPEVIHYQAGENVTIKGNIISADKVEVDDELSRTSTNPVENRVVYASLAAKADTDDLSVVAFTGNYDDLNNEPENFAQDDWALLWRN